MVEIFNAIGNFVGHIVNFLIYILSLPRLLNAWVLSLPPYLSEGIYLVLDLLLVIIVIKIFVLLKEGFKPW